MSGYPSYPPYGQPPPQQGGSYGYQQTPPAQQPYGAPPPQGQGQYYQQPGQQPPPGQYGAQSPQPPAHGQYGAPPPQAPYGAPSPQPPYGGAAPPPQPYGAPPAGQYYQPPPQQGAYGAPPPQQAQQGAYGAPPPQQGAYGAPPPQQGAYGAPPPQPYGQQPPYGAPSPAQGYGQPPPGQQPYGQQPPGQYGAPAPYAQQYPPTPPTLGYGPPQIIQWNADADAQALRAAMKGFGTDEKALIRILSTKDPLQVAAIRDTYSRLHRRNLEGDIRDETSGWLEKGLVQLVRGPLLNDVHMLHDAMDGPGTKEKVLNDVLLGRSNADMQAIKSQYQRTFHRRLEDAVRDDLSMKTERHFMIVLAAQRAEDAAPVIKAEIDRDVNDIYDATEGKIGTDEMKVCSILSTRNDNQIRAIAHEYKQKYARNLEDVIRKEFSGHMEAALLFQLRQGTDKYMHAAQLLEDSMAGAGTEDHLLVSRLVRFHWDRNFMANVRAAYEKRYRRNLVSRVRSETSGDYERLLVAIVG